MIQRELFEWGIVLTTSPFVGSKTLGSLFIRAEIRLPRSHRAPIVKISFTGATIVTSMDVTEAATWASAMQAIIAEARSLVTEMKTANRK